MPHPSGPAERFPAEPGHPLSGDCVPARQADASFEALLGGTLRRLAEAQPDAVDTALAGALAELCAVFELGGAAVLQRADVSAGLELTLEACPHGTGTLRDIAETWPELAHGPAGRALHLDASRRHEGAAAVFDLLTRRRFASALSVPLVRGGEPVGALLLIAGQGGGFPPGVVARVRIVADLIAIALPLRGPRYLPGELTEQQVRDFERQNLLQVVERSGWRLQGEQGAARALGLSPSTLRDRMRVFGIQRPR